MLQVRGHVHDYGQQQAVDLLKVIFEIEFEADAM